MNKDFYAYQIMVPHHRNARSKQRQIPDNFYYPPLQISMRAFFLAPMRFWSITKDTTREARYLPICSSTYVLGGIHGIPVSRPHEPLPVPYAFWYS
jgi:hypothetical protein